MNTDKEFWNRVDVAGDLECWVWLGKTDDKGRAYAGFNWRWTPAYRIAYELTFGISTKNVQIGHTCGNILCCNPHHLKIASKTVEQRFWEKVEILGEDDCWSWTGAQDGHGYGAFGVDGKTYKAYRFSYILANGKVPDGLLVCHKCNNRICVNPKHLYAGTTSDNAQDSLRCGSHYHYEALGEEAGFAKLKNSDVIKIKKLLRDGASCRKIGAMYGVTGTTIWAIKKGKNWGWLSIPDGE